MRLKNFSKLLKNLSIEPLHVLDISIPKSKYTPINLSENNHDLNIVDLSSVEKLGNFVSNHIKIHKASVAYGGYLEVRNIYKRSQHFNKQSEDERNIHLGIDFWSQEGTPIYAPLEGQVHSFNNNSNYGDYGPTIILEHNIKDITFYSLYGHLNLESIHGLCVGKTFNKGEQIGVLGDVSINGNYPPHLHFQIIIDVQDNQGDYPGVCSKKDLEFYSNNCPDPNLLLKI